jgi:hypothetical protein
MKAIPAMTANMARRTIRPFGRSVLPAQQLLYFLPLPQGQVSFLPTRIDPPWAFAGSRTVAPGPAFRSPPAERRLAMAANRHFSL